MISKSVIDKFMEYHIPVTESGCWIWLGASAGNGYGHISVNGKAIRVHRWSYSHFIGPIPEGLHVCHSCDVPACVNPAHLFLGTALDNKRDEIAKGRQAPPGVKRHRGSDNGRARLTEGDVRSIRSLYAGLPRKKYVSRGGLTAIARQFGVGPEAVRRIGRGESWSHVG